MENTVKCFEEDSGDLCVLSVRDIFTEIEGPNGNHVFQGVVPNAYFWTSVGIPYHPIYEAVAATLLKYMAV